MVLLVRVHSSFSKTKNWERERKIGMHLFNSPKRANFSVKPHKKKQINSHYITSLVGAAIVASAVCEFMLRIVKHEIYFNRFLCCFESLFPCWIGFLWVCITHINRMVWVVRELWRWRRRHRRLWVIKIGTKLQNAFGWPFDMVTIGVRITQGHDEMLENVYSQKQRFESQFTISLFYYV